jgi:hypothetical protein
LAKIDPKATKRRLSGVNLPGNLGGVNWTTTNLHEAAAGLRVQLTMAAEILASEGVTAYCR